MALLKYFSRLQYIDFLIRRRATGDLGSFASKNRLSKRNLTYFISEMKELGFPIKYDKARKSYYYEKEGHFVNKLFVESQSSLSRVEMSEISSQDINSLCYSEESLFEKC